MNTVIETKVFLNDEDFTILDINNPNVLDNLEINSFSITDGSTIVIRDRTYKNLYTDLEHPLVIKKDGNDNNIYINPNYYLNNQDKIDEIICDYIKNYKEEKFRLWDNGLIKDKTIDAIVSNKNIKEVSLAEYSKDGYTLTLEHYKKFKETNIRVGSKYVCDELKENFDDIIKLNSEKTLIGYLRYRDLISKKGLTLDRELTLEELDNLKYINPDLMIVLIIENFEHINVVNNRLKELGKTNNIMIKLDDKNKFNEYIFNHSITDKNIYVETPDLENVTLNDYLKFEKILYSMIKNTNNLSPFEKYIYAYNITKQFKEYKENEQNKNDSRKLYSLLVNEYMVCVGYSRLFGDLLSKMGIENKDLSIGVDVSYDDVSNYELEFRESIPTEYAGHARRYVHIVDPKYNLDGYYISDPTWDNDLTHDYYNHLAMTDKEVTNAQRYLFFNEYLDVFNINNLDEYIEKMNRIRKKYHYNDFIFEVKRIINVIKEIDIKLFNELYEKYNFIDELPYKWPESITDLIYEIGNKIINKVNKSIDSDTIMMAVKNVYKNSYGYSESELESKLDVIRQENLKRQNKKFPTRYKINQDGSSEIIMSEENKFESVMKM